MDSEQITLDETFSRYVALETEIRRSEILVLLEKILEKYSNTHPDMAAELTALLLDRWKLLDD